MPANFDVNDSFLNERPISNNAEDRFWTRDLYYLPFIKSNLDKR